MKQLVVISGKGGTGKTTLVAAFAALAQSKVLADCDVDAADLHLLLDPKVERSEAFEGSKVAILDQEKCIQCGACLASCRFGAISESGGLFAIDPFRCEGCGVCAFVCPAGAIKLEPRLSGRIYISSTRFGPLVHGQLEPGEGTSGKLVSLVKQRAMELAQLEGRDLIIVDGAPGIGCPVIASLGNATAALIVTEPTLSGIHDMERVLGVARHFRTRAFICINKCDLNREMARRIEEFAAERGLEVVGQIPYDDAVTEALVQGKTVVEHASDSPVVQEIELMWSRLAEVLELGEATRTGPSHRGRG
ncbi:MAG: 4Fe-4S binding protein [Candidatus Acetothermia bacterium]|jgi:MinD superfamily P-loop ATPase|nr:4Fe-4S binding protein [Candidatus Acetothermia bacterium]MDH7505092.1 4Fe-4S binding protein [Candidatus Acetothermia bacterium]